jgi:hypothetical protein
MKVWLTLGSFISTEIINTPKLSPFMNLSMSLYGAFCHPVVVRRTLDKRILTDITTFRSYEDKVNGLYLIPGLR